MSRINILRLCCGDIPRYKTHFNRAGSARHKARVKTYIDPDYATASYCRLKNLTTILVS
jgi:hypothetical protein